MSPLTDFDQTHQDVVVVDWADVPGNTSGEELGSFSGAGTLEMLDVVALLEASDITCCMVGVGALKYYGAWRVLREWEICVPSDKLRKAEAILTSPPLDEIYQQCPPNVVQLFSVYHTFPLLKVKGCSVRFYLVPSDDCRIDCRPSNIERSKMGLPYPKLDIFAQSLLDTLDEVPLADLIDGMDLDNKWGFDNLDLSGTQDIAWAERKNKRIRASAQKNDPTELGTEPCSVRPFWEDITNTKDGRIGPESPPGALLTRFRVTGQGDPRLTDRNYV